MKKFNLRKFKITNRGLYWGLIFTFALLYLCVGFVSTLHSITFFHLANNISLAILLGLTYEIGQASVLFSILMTRNKDKFLPWALMFLLTALQVTANVYASFKFMANSGSNDWQYWQKSILIGVQASNAEMYQVIISWIAGALLPIVALGMTALVAQNIKLAAEEDEQKEDKVVEEESHNIEVEEDFGPVDLTHVEPEKISEPVTINEAKITDDIIKKIKEEYDRLIIPAAVSTPNFETKTEVISPSVELQVTPEVIIAPNVEQKPLINDIKNVNIVPEVASVLEKEHFVDEKVENEIIEDDHLDNLDEIAKNLFPEEKMVDINDYDPEFQEAIKKTVDELIKGLPSTQPVAETFEKDLIVPESTKKRGRPPKQKEEDEDKAAVLKKEPELLPKEDVEVPKEKLVNPLEQKSKPEIVTDLKEVIKPSPGEEALELLENLEKQKQMVTTPGPVIIEEKPQESLLVPPELRGPYLQGGVEVIDAKAIPKKPEVKKN